MKDNIIIFLVVIFVLASFCPTQAQQATKSIPRIGFISSTGAPGSPSPLLDEFRIGLRDLGYIDGKNVLIERRYAEGRLDLMPALVNELVQEKVDAILAVNNVVIQAARKVTTTIPIVMVTSVDPVAAGYVESFARPGRNITGLAHLGRDLSAKRVELLKELLPRMSRVTILWDAAGPGPTIAFKEYEAAARGFKLELRSLEVRGPNPDFAAAFQTAKMDPLDAMIVVANPLMGQSTKQVFEITTKRRLVTMTEGSVYVEAGGLVSYGANIGDLYRRAAEYTVEIMKGAKPSDLPIKVASKFEILINLKTSQKVGLVVPQHLLVQADKVIK